MKYFHKISHILKSLFNSSRILPIPKISTGELFKQYLLTGVLPILLFTACENDIERINFLQSDENYPDLIGEGIELIYSDSAYVKVKMTAPELKQFNKVEKPYTEFPQGMHVIFYDKSLQIESEIMADYAKYYTEEKLWHATGNIIAKNLKSGEELNTEELFWDEEEERIYSDSYTKIVNENGTFYGRKGFRSNQSMTDYTLIGSTGVVKIEEEEEEDKDVSG